jgi:hypothetical protein
VSIFITVHVDSENPDPNFSEGTSELLEAVCTLAKPDKKALMLNQISCIDFFAKVSKFSGWADDSGVIGYPQLVEAECPPFLQVT